MGDLLVSSANLQRDYVAAVMKGLATTLASAREIYPSALYYAIIREAGLNHGSRQASDNLARMHHEGSIKKDRALPSNDRKL